MSGLIGHWAEERGHTVTPFAAYESIFPEVEDFDALVVMGAPLSVRDVAEDAGIAVALETTRIFLEAGQKCSKPTLALRCWLWGWGGM